MKKILSYPLTEKERISYIIKHIDTRDAPVAQGSGQRFPSPERDRLANGGDRKPPLSSLGNKKPRLG